MGPTGLCLKSLVFLDKNYVRSKKISVFKEFKHSKEKATEKLKLNKFFCNKIIYI